MKTIVARILCVAALLVAAPLGAQPPAGKKAPAPTESQAQAQARTILMHMAGFLGGARAFSVSLRSGYDVVQKSGQKIEFGETRRIALSRPDKLRIEAEGSDGRKTLTVLDGKEIVRVDFAHNAWASAPQPGDIDATLTHILRELGLRMPLAVLLMAGLPAEFEARVKAIDYVEKTNLQGAPAHHLAARTAEVDFQVWVADGDKPVPMRVVITYRKSPGQPQFWAQFADWNMAPAHGDAAFAAQPPAGAMKVDFATRKAKPAKR
jgi:hypothetical protein